MTWTNLSGVASGTPPAARRFHGFTSADGMLYVHGGEDVKGNTLEALLGAIFLDRGFSKTRKFIRKRLIKGHMFGSVPGSEIFDYKSALLIHCQRERVSMAFELLEEHLSSSGNEYTMGVRVDGTLVGKGRASSKRKAQQVSAKLACHHLGVKANSPV